MSTDKRVSMLIASRYGDGLPWSTVQGLRCPLAVPPPMPPADHCIPASLLPHGNVSPFEQPVLGSARFLFDAVSRIVPLHIQALTHTRSCDDTVRCTNRARSLQVMRANFRRSQVRHLMITGQKNAETTTLTTQTTTKTTNDSNNRSNPMRLKRWARQVRWERRRACVPRIRKTQHDKITNMNHNL